MNDEARTFAEKWLVAYTTPDRQYFISCRAGRHAISEVSVTGAKSIDSSSLGAAWPEMNLEILVRQKIM